MNELQLSKKYMEDFREAFSAGIDGIVKAAEIYVAAIDVNPKNADAFRDEFADWIPDSAWSGFEAVGRKWMHPKLLMGGGGRYSAKIKRLPYSQQERIFSGERFDLLTATGDKLKVDIRNCTPDQADQLFDGNHLRGLPEQKAYVEAHKATPVCPVTVAEQMPYTVRSGKVYFRKDCVLTREELTRLVLTV